MHRILVMGAGKIGSLIAYLLAISGDYRIFLSDIRVDQPLLKKLAAACPHLELVTLDANQHDDLTQFLQRNNIEAIVSSLPYFHNQKIISLAEKNQVNYFDLTEDVETARIAAQSAQKNNRAIVPQCGLAPGFISIVTQDLMNGFSDIDTVKMRTGALPLNSSNALHYALTWSTDGLINEYGNACPSIENGELIESLPLADLEEIKIDGLTYEAFNTSGGVGTLIQTCLGHVKQLTYKTIRYPGHCEKMRFLMQDLRLNEERDTLKHILENAIPKTAQDVVLVYASVMGIKDNHPYEKNYVKKFYPKTMGEFYWTAIQMTTASSLCAVLDIVMNDPKKYHGLIKQEQFKFDEFANNRFGKYFS